MRADQFPHQRHHAGDDLVLAVVAVGKEGVVRDVDVMRVGARSHDLTQDREPAKAGIEHQNRRGIGHVITLAGHGYHSVFGAVLRQGRLGLIWTDSISRLPHGPDISCRTAARIGTGPQNSGEPT